MRLLSDIPLNRKAIDPVEQMMVIGYSLLKAMKSNDWVAISSIRKSVSPRDMLPETNDIGHLIATYSSRWSILSDNLSSMYFKSTADQISKRKKKLLDLTTEFEVELTEAFK